MPKDQPGESNGRSKLTESQVRQIRSQHAIEERLAADESLVPRYRPKSLRLWAAELGISFVTLYKILRNQTWRHLK